MIYGIPNFKLEKEVVRRRADLLERGGIVFHLHCDVGSAESFAALRRRHDAVLVATGGYKARDIKVPGCGLGTIFPALAFLTPSNQIRTASRRGRGWQDL